MDKSLIIAKSFAVKHGWKDVEPFGTLDNNPLYLLKSKHSGQVGLPVFVTVSSGKAIRLEASRTFEVLRAKQ